MNEETLTNEQMRWLVAEYQKIREEIDRRSKEQFICISTSILAFGSVLGFISKSPEIYSPLLIIIPWISSIFGLVWTDHSHHIFSLGSYIREKIENQINQIVRYKTEIGWEHYIHRERMKLRKLGRMPSFIVRMLPLIYFVFPSIGSIATYVFMRFGRFTKLPIAIEVFLLIIGSVFTVTLILGWLRALKVLLK